MMLLILLVAAVAVPVWAWVLDDIFGWWQHVRLWWHNRNHY